MVPKLKNLIGERKKLKNSNSKKNLKTKIVTKHKNLICDKTQMVKTKTKIVTKLK